jgi:hypothetical protein
MLQARESEPFVHVSDYCIYGSGTVFIDDLVQAERSYSECLKADLKPLDNSRSSRRFTTSSVGGPPTASSGLEGFADCGSQAPAVHQDVVDRAEVDVDHDLSAGQFKPAESPAQLPPGGRAQRSISGS